MTSEIYTLESFDIILEGDSSVGMPDKVINWQLPEPVDGTKEELEEACSDACYFLAQFYNCQPHEFKITCAALEKLQIEAESAVDGMYQWKPSIRAATGQGTATDPKSGWGN